MPFPTLISINEWKQLIENYKKKEKNLSPDLSQANEEIEDALRAVYKESQIFNRLDALIRLYETTQKINTDPYQSLFKSVKEIIAHILDVPLKENEKVESIIEQKIKQRKFMKELDNTFMPWSRPKVSRERVPYAENDPFNILYGNADPKVSFIEFQNYIHNHELTQMDHGYKSLYVEDFRVLPHDGQLLKLSISGSGENSKLSFQSFHTRNMTLKSYNEWTKTPHDTPETGIYVYNLDGSLFVGPSIHTQRLSFIDKLKDEERIIHPSYGAHPFLAGELKGDVVLLMINAVSGHFKPDQERYFLAVEHLKKIKVVSNHTQLGLIERSQVVSVATQNQADIFNFIKTNEISYQNEDELLKILKKDKPDLAGQYEINAAYLTWKNKGKTYVTSDSVTKLKIDDAMDQFSKYADIKDPDKSLAYLSQAFKAIADWKKFHEKKASRRTVAVNDLEKQLLNFQFFFLLYKYLQDSKSTDPLVSKFLKFELNTEDFIKQLLQDQKNERRILTLFDHESEHKVDSTIANLIPILRKVNESQDNLAEVNLNLNALIAAGPQPSLEFKM